jgi:ATP-dependent Clp protease ATP-binding subunit ClpB
MDIKLEINDSALDELAKTGFDPVYGARPLKRAIQSQIENPLAMEILEGRIAAKDKVKVEYKRGKFTFSKVCTADWAKNYNGVIKLRGEWNVISRT